MKLVRSASVFAVALLASAGAFAATMPSTAVDMTTVPLAVVTNDRDASISRMALVLDAQSMVRGIVMKTRASARSAAPAKGRLYPLTKIETGKGVVLGQGQGVKAIYLRGQIATANGTGQLVIRYLSNGLFHHYRECRVNLQKVGPNQWQLVNAYDGHTVKHIKVKTWALGISTVANVCPGTRLAKA